MCKVLVMNMIFKLVEKFTSAFNRDNHYEKHIIKGQEFKKMDGKKKRLLTADEYEQMAEELSYKPIDNKRIFGYVSKDRNGDEAYAKWDAETEMFTVYVWRGGKTHTITAFSKDFREYNSEMWDSVYGYAGEIPEGK